MRAAAAARRMPGILLWGETAGNRLSKKRAVVPGSGLKGLEAQLAEGEFTFLGIEVPAVRNFGFQTFNEGKAEKGVREGSKALELLGGRSRCVHHECGFERILRPCR